MAYQELFGATNVGLVARCSLLSKGIVGHQLKHIIVGTSHPSQLNYIPNYSLTDLTEYQLASLYMIPW